jgi:hypothetical protein
MAETIVTRTELSRYAPRITTIHIDPDKIGKIIGPGGKMIRKIQEECHVDVDIEDDGTVFISAVEGPDAERAIEMIQALTEEAEIGKVYLGKVVRTESYGAFVEICPVWMAWCTSRNWPTTMHPLLRTWYTLATRSWSWLPTLTPKAAKSGCRARQCWKAGARRKRASAIAGEGPPPAGGITGEGVDDPAARG